MGPRAGVETMCLYFKGAEAAPSAWNDHRRTKNRHRGPDAGRGCVESRRGHAEAGGGFVDPRRRARVRTQGHADVCGRRAAMRRCVHCQGRGAVIRDGSDCHEAQRDAGWLRGIAGGRRRGAHAEGGRSPSHGRRRGAGRGGAGARLGDADVRRRDADERRGDTDVFPSCGALPRRGPDATREPTVLPRSVVWLRRSCNDAPRGDRRPARHPGEAPRALACVRGGRVDAPNLRKLVDAGILVEITGRRRDQRYLARALLTAAHPDG